MNFLLFVVAVLAGALNAVAGGGGFLTLPSLLHAGVSPVAANATSTFAVWPGSWSSILAYRKDIKTPRRTLIRLGGVSLAGGLLGGVLLVKTSDTGFMRLLPWLMLLAAVAFTFGEPLTRRRGGGHGEGHDVSALGVLLQLAIATYGGYFGGGMGIMMLATMSISGMTDIHEMNGLKSILAVLINCLALASFIVSGLVVWTPGLVMMAGTILGGYAGAAAAKAIDRRFVRYFVIAVGWTMTAYFFLR